MKHPIASLIPLLLAASGLHAQSSDSLPAPEPTKFSAEISLRAGAVVGQLLDKESSLYDDVGLRLINSSTHDTSKIDPSGSSGGLDVCVLYHITPSFHAGVAFVTQSTDVSPSQSTSNDLTASLLDEQAIMARIRYQAFSFGSVRFGIEGGLGRSSGTLHRFALAKKNLATIKAGILSSGVSNSTAIASNVENYINLGNQDLDVSGLRYEAMVTVIRPFTTHFAADARVGFHHSSLSPTDTDPLKPYTPAYPSPVTSVGIDFAIGLLASF